MVFCEKKLNLNLFKKLKKPTYVNNKKLLKLINVPENSIEEFNKNNNKIPTRLDYVEKSEIIDLHFIVLTVPFSLCMLALQI